jgi:hypothetical protein
MCSLRQNVFYLRLLISTMMSTKKTNKRKRGKGPMLDGDIDSAQAVMPQTISEIKKDGSTVTKRVWVSLDTPNPNLSAVEDSTEMPAFENEPADMSLAPPEQTNKYQVSAYIKVRQYNY